MEARRVGLVSAVVILFLILTMDTVTSNPCTMGNHVDESGKMKWILQVEEPCTHMTPGGYLVRQKGHEFLFVDKPFFSNEQQRVVDYVQQIPSDAKAIFSSLQSSSTTSQTPDEHTTIGSLNSVHSPTFYICTTRNSSDFIIEKPLIPTERTIPSSWLSTSDLITDETQTSSRKSVLPSTDSATLFTDIPQADITYRDSSSKTTENIRPRKYSEALSTNQLTALVQSFVTSKDELLVEDYQDLASAEQSTGTEDYFSNHQGTQINASMSSEELKSTTKQYLVTFKNTASTYNPSTAELEIVNIQLSTLSPRAAEKSATSDLPIYTSLWPSSGTANSSHTILTDDTTTVSGCPLEWITGGDDLCGCYLFQDTRLSWAQASNKCHSLGSHLVFIDSALENTFLATQLASLPGQYWTGLNDITTEGSWMWEAAKNVSGFTNWSNGSPSFNNNKNCGRITHDNIEWYDLSCEHTMSLICEM